MLLNLNRGTAITLSTVLLAGMSSAAAPASTTGVSRPGITHRPQATVNGSEQVLGEGGTLAAYVYGNLFDVEGLKIQGPNGSIPGRDQQSTAEVGTLKTSGALQFVYAPTGSGTASFDFVNQKSGAKGKNISQPYPFAVDSMDPWQGESSTGVLSASGPYGYEFPWAATAKETTNTQDTLHFAAGDAPLPLGDPADSSYDNTTDYANSLAAFNNGGTPPAIGQGNPGGFNPQRGPAVVVPLLSTGVATVFNTTNLVYTAPLKLTQADECGIFTGTITDWNATSAAKSGALTFSSGTGQPITIVHRSDGSGTSFLISYDLQQMCSSKNPKGLVTSANYWGAPGSTGRTQGVGTDSNNFQDSANTTIPKDTGAPEIVWPNSSLGASGNGGVEACVETGTASSTVCTTPSGGGSTPNGTGAGYVGYVSPSNAIGLVGADEAAVQNYGGNYEQANATTVAASFAATGTAGNAPPAYPTNAGLYFPFPTAATGAPIVGYTYGYFYQCTNIREKDQVSGIATAFKYLEAAPAKGQTSSPADAIVNNWQLTPLSAALKKSTTTAIGALKAEATSNTLKGTYIDPVNGAKDSYTCAPT